MKNCINFIDKWFFINNHLDKVYWIQLPPMRDQTYNVQMDLINQITENYFSTGIKSRYIHTYDMLGQNGNYTDYIEVDNEYTRVRNNDGMHLSFDGAKVVARRLLKNIHDDFSFEIHLNTK